MKSAFLAFTLLLAAFTLRAQIPSGCVAYYPFNGNLKDSTGQGPTGTNHGAEFTTDRNGLAKKALAFNGDNTEYIDLGDPYSYSSVSICVWINPDNTSAARVFLSSLANITQFKNTGVELQVSENGKLDALFGNVSNAPSSYRRVLSASTLPYGKWSHIAVTIHNMSAVTIYINGNLDVYAPVPGLAFSTSQYNMFAGVRSYPATESPFYGSMDELMFFNRALSASEVAALYEIPKAAFGAPNVCLGQVTHFTDSSAPQTSFTYSWEFGDNTTSTVSNPSHTYSSPGTYTVSLKVTNSGGKSDSTSRDVIVYPLPEASFKTTINMKTVRFAPADSTLDSYTWDFGDTSHSFGRKPVHTYTHSGSYTVTLTTRNQYGCDSMSSQVITVSSSGIDNNHRPGLEVLLYPVPVIHGELNLEINSQAGECRLRISDMQGRECYKAKIPAGAGGIRKTINLSGYKSGIYLVTVATAESVYYRKVIVK